MVPDGFDLFATPWNPPKIDVDNPFAMEFFLAARKAGFDIQSEGFQDMEEAYFEFFMMGRESCK